MTGLTSAGVASAYLSRLEDEYGLSLDAALQLLLKGAEPLLAACSSPFFAVELLKRCSGALVLLSTPGLPAAAFAHAAAGWAWGNLTACEAPPAGWAAALVAEAHLPSFAGLLADLTRRAAPGARLAVLCSTPLRRLGWQVQALTGFHAPASGAWGMVYRLAGNSAPARRVRRARSPLVARLPGL